MLCCSWAQAELIPMRLCQRVNASLLVISAAAARCEHKESERKSPLNAYFSWQVYAKESHQLEFLLKDLVLHRLLLIALVCIRLLGLCLFHLRFLQQHNQTLIGS